MLQKSGKIQAEVEVLLARLRGVRLDNWTSQAVMARRGLGLDEVLRVKCGLQDWKDSRAESVLRKLQGFLDDYDQEAQKHSLVNEKSKKAWEQRIFNAHKMQALSEVESQIRIQESTARWRSIEARRQKEQKKEKQRRIQATKMRTELREKALRKHDELERRQEKQRMMDITKREERFHGHKEESNPVRLPPTRTERWAKHSQQIESSLKAIEQRSREGHRRHEQQLLLKRSMAKGKSGLLQRVRQEQKQLELKNWMQLLEQQAQKANYVPPKSAPKKQIKICKKRNEEHDCVRCGKQRKFNSRITEEEEKEARARKEAAVKRKHEEWLAKENRKHDSLAERLNRISLLQEQRRKEQEQRRQSYQSLSSYFRKEDQQVRQEGERLLALLVRGGREEQISALVNRLRPL